MIKPNSNFNFILFMFLTLMMGVFCSANEPIQEMSVLTSPQSFIESSHSYDRRFALGMGFAFNSKSVEADKSFSQFVPEISGSFYLPYGRSMILRPGLRVGYSGSQQPSSTLPQSISLEEYDLKNSLEIGFLFPIRTFFIPAFTVGGGTIYRTTKLIAKAPIISSSESISGSTWLPFVYSQISGIVPFQNGKYEFSPFVRYHHIFSDSRINWALGLEGSFGFL